MERFSRIQSFLGEEGFRQLQQSFITIVGIGAVGGHVAEGLARAGISRLRLVDFDTIHPSNINRQIMALDTTLGRPKVEVAKERIAAINPACRVEALQLFAGDESLEQILSPAPDILIDAIDSMNPKVQLLTAAHTCGIPIISSMGAALRSDPTQIRIADIMDTKNCPLARRLRQRLRRAGIERGISCVFSTEAVSYHYDEPEETPDPDEPMANRGRQRRSLGSLPTLTGIFGLVIANEVIMRLSSRQL
ncbi:MAG: tRNA threonylcarbamoyladenosine dehydratase [Desulfocapsaceae bacterium]|nr:tRNA threonylcarbamoyladenosine dehydratase [Desulfocapsaceae bacterium]